MKQESIWEYTKRIEKEHKVILNKQCEKDWRWCPRCHKKEINRDRRECNACKGRVFWESDLIGINDAIERRDGFFIWHTSIEGVTGWFDQSYWGIKYKYN